MKFPEGGGLVMAGFLMGSLLTPSSDDGITNNANELHGCIYSQDIQGVRLEYCYKVGELLDTKYTLSGITNGERYIIEKFNIKGPILRELSENDLNNCFNNSIDYFLAKDGKKIQVKDIKEKSELGLLVEQVGISRKKLISCVGIN